MLKNPTSSNLNSSTATNNIVPFQEPNIDLGKIINPTFYSGALHKGH